MMKKWIALALVFVLALSLAVPALAANAQPPEGPGAARGPLVHCPYPGCTGFMHQVSDGRWLCDTCHRYA